MICDLVENSQVSAEFLCTGIQEGETKQGKVYFTVRLTDSSGSIEAKIWNKEAILSGFEPGEVVSITGSVSLYNNEKQITIKSIKKSEVQQPLLFVPRTKYDVDTMWQSLKNRLDMVDNMWCRMLLTEFFSDEDIGVKFREHSAAVSVHHAYVGGLLEHTLHVVLGAYAMAKAYTNLNKDLLITAAALHDIGKLHEISAFPENQYTLVGHCVGHVSEGAMMVKAAADSIPGFPEDVKLKIIHCILAHHGKLEWGSPVLPALPEAVVISRMDELDATLKQFEEVTTENQWTTYNKYLGLRPGSGEFCEEE